MKDCCAYIRVSTDEQAKEGYSLDNQKKACMEYAKNNGLHIKRIFIEDGKSARTTERPVYKEMLLYLKNNPVYALLVYKIDRLARNVIDFGHIRKELKKYGN